MIASSQWRLVSLQLSEKCLIVEITPSPWIPAIDSAGEHGAQQRVLGEVLEVAAVARVAREVDAAGEHHVEAAAARLAADHRARRARQRRVEARAQRDARRQRGRGVARPVARVGDPEAGVAHEQRRDPEPRARPGRSPRSSARPSGMRSSRSGMNVVGAHDADEQREALLVGHLRLGLARPRIGVGSGHGRERRPLSSGQSPDCRGGARFLPSSGPPTPTNRGTHAHQPHRTAGHGARSPWRPSSAPASRRRSASRPTRRARTTPPASRRGRSSSPAMVPGTRSCSRRRPRRSRSSSTARSPSASTAAPSRRSTSTPAAAPTPSTSSTPPPPLDAVTVDGGAGNDTLARRRRRRHPSSAAPATTSSTATSAPTPRSWARGNDTSSGTPGDGSDTVDGQGGSDALAFNGSNIGENIDVSANGSRVRLTRNVAAITMDLAGIERTDVRALGGTDTVTVNDLSGTDLDSANVDLNGFDGTADGSADTVIANGTDAADDVDVSSDARPGGRVARRPAASRVTGSEPTLDNVNVATLGGDDTIAAGVDFTGTLRSPSTAATARTPPPTAAPAPTTPSASRATARPSPSSPPPRSRSTTSRSRSSLVQRPRRRRHDQRPERHRDADPPDGRRRRRRRHAARRRRRRQLLGGAGDDLVDGNIGADTAPPRRRRRHASSGTRATAATPSKARAATTPWPSTAPTSARTSTSPPTARACG